MATPVGRNNPCPCGSGRKFKKCCIGRPMGPVAHLVEENDSDRWKIELKNFSQFRDALGADVMNAFCRCFVHADRLTSMISFAHVSERHHSRESVAFGRNLNTMVWFTIGSLRELAIAIRDLRSALKKRGILEPDSAPWIKLLEVEKRWEDEPLFRGMRNVAAFHVDEEVVEKGLNALAKERDVVLCKGEGPKSDGTSLTIGLEALFNGLGMDLDAFSKFLESVGDDLGIGVTIQEAFILATKAAGIPFGD